MNAPDQDTDVLLTAIAVARDPRVPRTVIVVVQDLRLLLTSPALRNQSSASNVSFYRTPLDGIQRSFREARVYF